MTALSGLRVIEVSQSMAGALAGMVMADNGAEVVLVEPAAGHPLRADGSATVFHRGKCSSVIDLRTTQGREQFQDLVKTADALVEDLGFGAADALGIGYSTLAAQVPHLVYASITGYGEHGPLRDLPVDEAIASAISGRMATHTTGREGPVYTPTPIASYGAGMLAVQGLLAALRAARSTGTGQRVHTSLLHALVAFDMTSGFGHRIHQTMDNSIVYGVMPLCFMTARCSDGGHIQMASRLPHQLRNWFRVLDIEHVWDDPDYAQVPEMFPNRAALDRLVDLIQSRMRTRTKDEWLKIFDVEGVGADPFLTPQQFLHTEQAAMTDRVRVIEDRVLGSTRQIGPLAVMSRTPSVIDTAAPVLGADTHSVLSRSRPVTGATGPAEQVELRYPLEGVTVLECASAYAAPFAMTLLAEMGARVIKVEPPQGDLGRRNWVTDYSKEAPGKEVVVVDLKTEAGREIVHKLAVKADIFLHNFRPGVPERLGIDFPTLSSINSRLVYLYGSCFGSSGPWSHRPGYHSTPNAIAGAGVLEAGSGNPPQNRTYGDPVGALGLATAALTALHARDEEGQGQYVETTMLASLGHALAAWSLEYPGKPASPVVDTEQRGFDALHRLYETDEGWLLLACRSEREWNLLVGALAMEALFDDRFGDQAARTANDAELVALLAAAFAAGTADSWQELLLSVGVPAVRADGIDFADFMLKHPHMQANGLSVEDRDVNGNLFWRSAGSVDFEMSSRRGRWEPLGGSTDAVLRELGYRKDEIDELFRVGVTKPVDNGLRRT